MKTAYLCYCRDSRQGRKIRQAELQQHLEYIESIMEQVLVAGALRDENDAVTGSVLIYDTDDREHALRLLKNDPYFTAGVWSDYDCKKMRLAAGQWIGGRGW